MTSRRCQFVAEAQQLREQAAEILQPLHEELLESGDAYDGITYFAVDNRAQNWASAMVSLRPEPGDEARHEFARASLDGRQVDLGATALGAALKNVYSEYIPSRMNPERHITWTQPVTENQKVAGGLQAAFRRDGGSALSERQMGVLWGNFDEEITDVGQQFAELSRKVKSPMAHELEFELPVTPNAVVIGWDMVGSSILARDRYGTLERYLDRVKPYFQNVISEDHTVESNDTADGQHFVISLPESVDRANNTSLREYLNDEIRPLVQQLSAAHHDLAAKEYPDINPEVRFAIGMGAFEERFGRMASRELWHVGRLLGDKTQQRVALALTDAVRRLTDGDEFNIEN